MASDAGRRVVLGSFELTAVAFGIAVVLIGAGLLVSVALGWISAGGAWHVAIGLGGGASAVAFAYAMLPALARFSRIGQEISLMELCDPGAPLLRDLSERAAGTYNHSIMVGALAEAGARSIGADPLLARVGAYYHDIGKLARPAFFAENQLGLRNPHDTAGPEQSVLVITAHVHEGVEMAVAAGLPTPVIDIIAQHHGKSLVAYFYRKASAAGVPADEAPYRYQGDLPQTREAGVVMLADAAEAIARGLSDSGPVQIEAAVRRIAQVRIDDHQLAGSGLSESDVEAVVVACAKMLSGLRHSRVAYPEDTEGEHDARSGKLEP